MIEELKPCPFCGEQHEWTDDIYQDGYCDSGIVCHRRILIMAELDKKEVGEIFWNMRPIEDKLRRENEQMNIAISEIYAATYNESIANWKQIIRDIAEQALNEVTK